MIQDVLMTNFEYCYKGISWKKDSSRDNECYKEESNKKGNTLLIISIIVILIILAIVLVKVLKRK